MLTNLCLLLGALVTPPPADQADWLLVPRLSRGQELVYRGSYSEEALGKGVQFNRSYRLETRVFVLETPPRGLDVAVYTVLKLRVPASENSEPEPSSVRLALAQVDLQARVIAEPGVTLSIPFDGPATLESAAFVEAPNGRLGLGQTWSVLEANRPPRLWKVLGIETSNGTQCLKLEGLQHSEDWDHPRADRTAWRRRDTVWLAPRLGVAYKMERTIERREPARSDPNLRSFTQYELQSDIQYPGQLFEDRRREIVQAQQLTEAIAPLIANPRKYDGKPFENILVRIAHHLENQPPTPYREAVLQVKRRAEAGRRGESPPTAVPDELTHGLAAAALDQPAPDFIATNLLTNEATQLRRWLGRPILLVFYHPSSTTVEPVLRFAQAVHDKYRQQVAVLGFCVSAEVEPVKKQHHDLGLSVPIHAGNGLRASYGVEATPKLMILDAAGVVRGNYIGWGPETSALVSEELARWLRKDLTP